MKRSCLEARGLEKQGEGGECGQFLQCIESVGCYAIVSKHRRLEHYGGRTLWDGALAEELDQGLSSQHCSCRVHSELRKGELGVTRMVR